jgi:hypothetical protein
VLGFRLPAPGEERQVGHDQSVGVVEMAADRAVQRIELALIGQAQADDHWVKAAYQVRPDRPVAAAEPAHSLVLWIGHSPS